MPLTRHGARYDVVDEMISLLLEHGQLDASTVEQVRQVLTKITEK
ncbi:MAG TPA: hypothetical protein VH593_05105 [Ktedonobacteraceae bacterium]